MTSPGWAQDSEKGNISLDAVKAEYRELILRRASDFSDPLQANAITRAITQGYRDESVVNEAARDYLTKALKDRAAAEESERLSSAIRLLKVSSLSANEQIELVFPLLLLEESPLESQLLWRRVQEKLQEFPDETSKHVAQSLAETKPTKWVMEAAAIPGSASEQSIPHLLKIAAGDDSVAKQAMALIPDLLQVIRNRQERAAVDLESAEIDERMMRITERIFQRFDNNQDQRLTKGEYDSMLMSPESADLNGDGEITPREYAFWMQSRQRR